MYKQMRTLIFLFLLPLPCTAAESHWPGLPPDCWSESRMFHSTERIDPWQKNTFIKTIKAEKPKNGELSPNKGYFFLVEGGSPNGKITIYAEKDHLVQISFSELFGLSDVKWINEKLLFMRPWWGRIAATDIIYDVEKEQVIYSEFVTDGYMAFQQFQESCPTLGCQCIKKK